MRRTSRRRRCRWCRDGRRRCPADCPASRRERRISIPVAYCRLTAASTSMPSTAAPSAPAAPSITESPIASTPPEGAAVPGRRLPPRGGGGAVGAAVPVWNTASADCTNAAATAGRDIPRERFCCHDSAPGGSGRRPSTSAYSERTKTWSGALDRAASEVLGPRRGPSAVSPSKLPVSRYRSTPARNSAGDGGRRNSPRWRRTTLSETPRAIPGTTKAVGRCGRRSWSWSASSAGRPSSWSGGRRRGDELVVDGALLWW